jgi:hypothetical protein
MAGASTVVRMTTLLLSLSALCCADLRAQAL